MRMAGGKRLIMLVDDDLDFLEMNRGVLEVGGFRVSCFTDSGAAWESLERERPDLVVIDLMMKALDAGFSFARKIKDDPRLSRIPVIIVTAISSQRGFDFSPISREELQAMRADAFFDKPVAPDLLLTKIEELLP